MNRVFSRQNSVSLCSASFFFTPRPNLLITPGIFWFPTFAFQFHIMKKKSFLLEGVGFLVAQLVKNLPEMRETWILSLGWEYPLEKGIAIHSYILTWRIPWTMGSQRVGHDWAIFTHIHTHTHTHMKCHTIWSIVDIHRTGQFQLIQH